LCPVIVVNVWKLMYDWNVVSGGVGVSKVCLSRLRFGPNHPGSWSAKPPEPASADATRLVGFHLLLQVSFSPVAIVLGEPSSFGGLEYLFAGVSVLLQEFKKPFRRLIPLVRSAFTAGFSHGGVGADVHCPLPLHPEELCAKAITVLFWQVGAVWCQYVCGF